MQAQAFDEINPHRKQLSEEEVAETYRAVVAGVVGPERKLGARAMFARTLNRQARKALKVKKIRPHEDPLRFELLKGLAEDIRRSAHRLKLPTMDWPTFGTLPTGRTNAMAMQVPGTDAYLMVFETGLFTMLYLIAKVIIQAAPITREGKALSFSLEIDQVRAHLDRVPAITQRFFEVLAAYSLTGQPAFAQPYLLPQNQAGLAITMTTAAELFVMGHEYGHIVAKHLDQGITRPQTLGNTPLQEVVQNWECEFEADWIGLQLADAAMKNRGADSSVSYIGPDLFFACAEVLGKAVSTLHAREADAGAGSATHPPPAKRKAHLRRRLTERAGSTPDAIGFGQQIDDIVQEMWVRVAPRLEQLHDQGHHLDPRWRRFR